VAEFGAALLTTSASGAGTSAGAYVVTSGSVAWPGYCAAIAG
jgi:hypothetical protein